MTQGPFGGSRSIPNNVSVTLEDWGWSDEWHRAWTVPEEDGLVPGRVVAQFQHLYRCQTATGEFLCEVAGRFRHRALSPGAFPTIGDWVALKPRPDEGRGTIHGVVPRKSQFVRKAAGEVTLEQVVAANVDTVFLMMGLDGDFNPRRLERYLALAHRSNARPVVVLNKLDLCADPPARIWEATSLAGSAPVIAVSSRWGGGFEQVDAYLHPRETVAVIGSSGVGKSTLINRLLGEDRIRTQEVRSGDQRGRHTTTHRELIRLEDGVLVIDTPGMREIQLWESEETLDDAFDDVATLAEGCRFRDCAHGQEPGCALRAAIAEGRLLPERLASFQKLQREAADSESLKDSRLRALEKKRTEKSIAKLQKQHYKSRDKR